jgi:L-ascorbate metabolism protein UlaG (beta-lactamase superfamily)
MKIKWNGHASFTITASDGTVLVTDPYDPNAYSGALLYDPVGDRADGVLVSHDHADHNYVEGLAGSPTVIRDSGKVKNIQIAGIQTYHDTSGGAERGGNVIFVFAVDGIRICFVGDLGHQLLEEQMKAVGAVDLLLLPVGGTFTIDARGAAEVAESLAPRVVIPMHFKTAKCHFPIAGVDDFLSSMKLTKRLRQSEIALDADSLPAKGMEVWVLEHAC